MADKLCNNVNAVAFINLHRADCEQIARQLQVPVENILGLAAQESQYAQGRIAHEYNNYFSMHAPAPLQIAAHAPLGNAKIKVAEYASFLQGAQSFAARYGNAVKGKTDPLQFAEALVKIGFNSGNASNGGRAGFAKYLAGIIETVKGRMSCHVK